MDEFDYVVVGAGSAGCVVASRLSEDPATSVLLLEAGPSDSKLEVRIPAAFPKLFKTERDWAYFTVPQPNLNNRELYWPRGKMLGGCSSINAQMYVRGNPADFDEWESLGNPGWAWSDSLGYFRRAEHLGSAPWLSRSAGPLYVQQLRDPSPLTRAAVKAAIESGLTEIDDVNGASQEGVALSSVSQRLGRRWSAADAYLRPARKRSNLTVVTGALTRRVVLDGTRATGIEYEVGGQSRSAPARREVIVSCGAVNSPALLMLSGIGPAAELRDLGIDVTLDVPEVGRNLQDHLALPVIFTTPSGSLLDAEKPQQLIKYLALRRGMLTSNVGEAMAFVRSRPELAAPDVQMIMAPVEYIDHGLAPPPGHGMTIGGVLLRPNSRGAVTLASADPATAPRIDPNYLAEADDIEPLVEAVKLARRIAAAPALKGVLDGEFWPGASAVSDDQIKDFVREQAFTLYHPVGTCRMGTDPGAVVDPDLKVRGIERLRVVDASIMPVITRGNTNAPSIMIGEQAAARIKAGSAA